MKKDTRTKAAVRKTSVPPVPSGDPQLAAQAKLRAAPEVPALPDWRRYADSRLKQFCCR